MNEVVQRSHDWYAIRCGLLTASRVADMMARTKSGWGASRANYAAQLVAERLTGAPAETYTNAAMQWGVDHEAEARVAYEFYTGEEVTEVGFVHHPSIAMSGASPDGCVGSDGLVEIKCPSTATHIETLLNPAVDGKYVMQMQWQLACTGRRWCDFASYDPRMPEAMRLVIIRVYRDDEMIVALENEARVFLGEIDNRVSALRLKYMREAA